jgi:hypothetical protein
VQNGGRNRGPFLNGGVVITLDDFLVAGRTEGLFADYIAALVALNRSGQYLCRAGSGAGG